MPANRIDRVFLRMAVIYGHLWKGLFRDKQFIMFAKKEWASALVEFSDEVVFQAVTLSRQRFEMPPTLPQFVQLCSQSKPVVYKSFDNHDAESNQNSQVAEKYLLEISKILRK